MTIFQCISSGGFYGAETMVLNLSAALRQLGHRVVLGVFLNRERPNLEVATRARKLGIEVVLVECKGRFDLGCVRRLTANVRDSGADLVHAHGYKADLYTFASNFSSRLPLVATCHNWTNASTSLSWYARLDRWCLSRFDRVFCVSEPVRDILTKSRADQFRVVCIPNGVDVPAFATARATIPRGDSDALVVGIVGRLTKEKGLYHLLEAAPAILRSFPTTRFVLVGDGPERDSLSKACEALGIARNVVFTGRREDMPGVYRSLDLLVLPSLNEGMPMSILEAMSAGVPVIASRVGGIPQIVEHEVTGLLVEPRDVAALQSSVERLLGNSALRLRLSQAGRGWVESHGSSLASAKRYISHYEKLIGDAPIADVA